VTAKLQDNPAIASIKILRVLITERQGDERRIKITRDMTVEREHQDLKLLEAETERKCQEVERQMRFQEKEFEFRLNQVEEFNKQRHAQKLKVIEAYAQVLSKAAELGQLEALGVSSRRRPELPTNGLENTLSQGLNNLQSALQAPPINPLSTYTSAYNKKAALTARLASETTEISKIDGVEGCYLEIGKEEDEEQVVVKFDKRMLNIRCSLGYPHIAPQVRWADNGHTQVPIQWSEGKSLSHIVADIQATGQA